MNQFEWVMFMVNQGYRSKLFYLVAILAGLCFQAEALASSFEVSGSYSYNMTRYGSSSSGNDSYEWTRRWSLSFGFYFTSLSEVEISMQDALNRTNISGIEDTTLHDQIYSVEWVQSLTPKGSLLQPFFKLGIGELNRDASGTYYGGSSPPAVYDSLTGVLGAGLRIYVLKTFGLRFEGTTYLSGGVLSTWNQNLSYSAGCSIYF